MYNSPFKIELALKCNQIWIKAYAEGTYKVQQNRISSNKVYTSRRQVNSKNSIRFLLRRRLQEHNPPYLLLLAKCVQRNVNVSEKNLLNFHVIMLNSRWSQTCAIIRFRDVILFHFRRRAARILSSGMATWGLTTATSIHFIFNSC